MASYQITCVHGQCDDPLCGSDFVFIGDEKVEAAALIGMIEANEHRFWTLTQGKPVDVTVEHGVDGIKRLVPGRR